MDKDPRLLTDADLEKMTREQRRIGRWLKHVKFRRQFFGGVSERDVWKKIGELNEMYNTALAAERARFDALLEQLSASQGEGPAGGRER